MSRVLFVLGILARGWLWVLCALFIGVTYAKLGGRAYPFTWSATAVTALPLAIRALVARIRHRPARPLPVPPLQSVYRTPAASRQPPPTAPIPMQLVVDTLVPVAFIACAVALDYDPSPEPEPVKVCCCAPCI